MLLQAQKLSIGYGIQQPIVQEINFNVSSRSFCTLLGVNGIGKSTLLKTIAGLIKPLSGSVYVHNKELLSISAKDRAQLISYVTNEVVSSEYMSVHEFVALGRYPYTGFWGNLNEADKTVIETAIEETGIRHLSKRYMQQLSDGEKQLAGICRALCQQTPIMLLDEPSSFLDFKNRERIFVLLRNLATSRNMAIILSTHDISTAIEHSSHLMLMSEQHEFSYSINENFTELTVKRLLTNGN